MRGAPSPDSAVLRLCHLADIHLGFRRYSRLTPAGFNQREADVNQSFHEAVDRVIQCRPDATLIAGDLFHSVRQSNAVITFCFKELQRLSDSTKAPVILCAGNHETPRRTDSGSLLRLFGEIDGVYVADAEAQRFSFPEKNLSVYCLPHAALAENEREGLRADERFRFNVLVLHGQTGIDSLSDFGGANIDFKSLSPHEWDYIACGHFHHRRRLALNACYSGAIEHTASNVWAECGEPKGFLEIELPGVREKFHALTSPRDIVELDPIYGEDGMTPADFDRIIAERLEEAPGGIDGKIARLEIHHIPREVYRLLDHKALRRFRAKALNLTIETRAPAPVRPAGENGERRGLRASSERQLHTELAAFVSARAGEGRAGAVRGVLEGYLKKLDEDDETAQRQP